MDRLQGLETNVWAGFADTPTKDLLHGLMDLLLTRGYSRGRYNATAKQTPRMGVCKSTFTPTALYKL